MLLYFQFPGFSFGCRGRAGKITSFIVRNIVRVMKRLDIYILINQGEYRNVYSNIQCCAGANSMIEICEYYSLSLSLSFELSLIHILKTEHNRARLKEICDNESKLQLSLTHSIVFSIP